MAQTENLKLYVTPTSDTTTNVMDWFHQMAASDMESNMVKIDRALGDVRTSVGKNASAITTLEDNVKSAEFRIGALEAGATESLLVHEEMQKAIDDVTALATATDEHVALLQDATDSLNGMVSTLQTKSDELSTDVDQLNIDTVALRGDVTDLQTSSSTLGARIDDLDAVVAELHDADITTGDLITATQAEVETLKTTVSSMSDSLDAMAGTVTSTSETVDTFQGALEALAAKDITLSAQIGSLQEQLDNGGGGTGGVAFSKMEYNIDEEQLHIYDAEGNDVVDPAYIPRGGGDSSGMIVMLSNLTGKNTLTVATGKGATVSYSFTSIMSHDQSPTGNGTAKYTLDDNVLVSNLSVEQTEHTYTIPADLLAAGNHTFVVEVDNGQNIIRTLKWTIVVKTIGLTTDVNEYAFYTGEVFLNFTPIGSGIAKTTSFELDGKLLHVDTTSEHNIPRPYTIPDQTHGEHTLKVWTEATIGGDTVQTEPLLYQLVWYDEGRTEPIVSFKRFNAPLQHTAVSIPYMVYDPQNSMASIELFVNDEPTDQLSVNRNVQYWSYTPRTAGTHKLTIKCNNVVETIEFEVATLDVPVQEAATGLMWKFDPSGRSNSDVNRDKWSNGDVSLSVPSDFHWNRGGWTVDEQGYPCFKVPAGDTVTFSAKPFSTDWRNNGHNLKVVFKANNVCSYNAQVAACMYNNIGFAINAQSATFKTAGLSTSVPLCEDKYTELEWNITKGVINNEGQTPEKGSDYREIVTWLQGIPSAVAVYNNDDNFIQDTQNSVGITFGSNDCDVYIYKIREYRNQLNDDQIFNNWVVDAPNGTIMSERYNRNLFMKDDGTIDYDELAKLHPNLRVLLLTCNRFTDGKDDPVEGCTLRHIMMADPNKHCWTVEGIIHEGQGTSSNEYGDSGRNLDFDFDGQTILFDDGTTSTGYAMTDNSIPVDYFNLKVNVASSENANNACLTREYQRFNPYLRAIRQLDGRVRDTMEFHPAVIFVKDLSGKEFGDTEFHFYAAGDLGNSKKNYEAQGLDADNPKECIVELRNNTGLISKWKSDNWENEKWDGDSGDLDFRFPKRKNATQEMKDSFYRVLSWVVSTDRDQATNASLPSPVVYNGITYRTDTADYRKAKFINEFDDYFISDSVMFYYLFTERHSMVDNRAKNTFWHTEDGLHWDLCFDYDND